MSHATSTAPSSRIYDSPQQQRYGTARHQSPYSPGSSSATTPAIPMAIPRAREEVPPPLPPPRYFTQKQLQDDIGWKMLNDPNSPAYAGQYSGTIKPGSSLLGGAATLSSRDRADSSSERPEYPQSRRASTLSIVMNDQDMSEAGDEDGSSTSRPTLDRLRSERQLGQKAVQASSNDYDKSLLSKIGGPNNQPGSTKLKPLAMPDRTYPSVQSPIAARWPASSLHSPAQGGFKSPVFEHASDSLSLRKASSTPHDDRHRDSIDQQGMFGLDMEETTDMRNLNIGDGSPGTEEYKIGGIKRRASSPPGEAARDDRQSVSGSNDLYRRRSQHQLLAKGSNSPGSRYQPGSLLSAGSSLSSHRTGSSYNTSTSYAISLASSATSYGSEQGALSPSAESELGPISPFAANRPVNSNNPRGTLSSTLSSRTPLQQQQQQQHRQQLQRGFPDSNPTATSSTHARKSSQDSMQGARHGSVSKIPGLHICECCPKKPRKFDSEEELRIHEAEKQYTCAFCPNRFKNKNEAERHQNSLHLRRHSWSCSALAGVPAAFHASSIHPGNADICGYCGEEFAIPPNWDMRAEHLNLVHKYSECNKNKKFFRADHFRQHLKHSHAGTSGKWTNMLENACMKDEPPPKDRMPPMAGSSGTAGPAAALKSGAIDEVHDES